MSVDNTTSTDVRQVVPFLSVTNMEASLRFYVDGLGFKMNRWWIPDEGQDDYEPDGRIRWCWLELGDAAIMLQELMPARNSKETLGRGFKVCFQCEDALELHRQFKLRGGPKREPSNGREPFVGCAGYRP